VYVERWARRCRLRPKLAASGRVEHGSGQAAAGDQ
jgi:hypothetical protein